jgi:hypothetical protein
MLSYLKTGAQLQEGYFILAIGTQDRTRFESTKTKKPFTMIPSTVDHL